MPQKSKIKGEISIQDKMQSLAQVIRRYNNAYYNADAPLVPDSEYDRVFRALKDLEDAYPQLILPNTPTKEVGAAVAQAFSKVKHRSAMLSLDNAMNKQELEEFNNG